MGRRTPRHCAHRERAHGARHALYRDQSERPSQQVSLRENLLRPWSGRKLHQELETPSRLRSHIMLEGQRQPDAASDPPLRLLADVDAASRLSETFAVAASPVRHTPLESGQDRSNCRREENTDHHVAARVMSTTKPDPPPVRRTRPHLIVHDPYITDDPPRNRNPQTPNHITTFVVKRPVVVELCAGFKAKPGI